MAFEWVGGWGHVIGKCYITFLECIHARRGLHNFFGFWTPFLCLALAHVSYGCCMFLCDASRVDLAQMFDATQVHRLLELQS